MTLDLLDWRRRVAALYADIRAATDPAEAHNRWRFARGQLFSTHPQSAAAAGTVLRYADYNPSLRFEPDVEIGLEPLRIEIPTATDGVVPFERIGRVQLGDLGSLDVWWLASYGGGVWLPVRDTDPATYGGGRYVLDTVKGADLGGDIDPATGSGTLVVDLNFAYNPSCAYDERWACPLAPPGNVIDEWIEAGELLPG
ncbi:MAG: uncharacterized protein QOJ03_2144 [Frankiaceae bacterium]|jgi:uncharacterized protein (DUF1684 family)|nr:uncharacterized protein [Frankiaceae bacterium]